MDPLFTGFYTYRDTMNGVPIMSPNPCFGPQMAPYQSQSTFGPTMNNQRTDPCFGSIGFQPSPCFMSAASLRQVRPPFAKPCNVAPPRFDPCFL